MDNEILKEEKRSFARSDVSKGLPAVAGHLAVLHMSSVDPGITSDSSLKPHCHNIGSSWKRSSRVDDIDRREQEVKSSSSSPQASPPPSAKYSVGVGDWYDIENSIYEAILHCKRSIEK